MARVRLLPRLRCAAVVATLCTLSVGAAGPAGAQEQAVLDVLRIVDGEYTVETVTVPARSAEAEADRLERAPDVVAASPSVTFEVAGTPDPLWDADGPGQASDVRTAWDRTRGEGQTVAVLDTGVDGTHPDLAGAVVGGTDTVGGSGSPWHGTGVAGVIAARADNGIGGAGMAPAARIMPIRVCNDAGCPSASVARGVLWAADHGADVINLSLAGAGFSDVTATAIRYAIDKNISVVASAGNDGDDGNPVMYPAANSGAIAVSATTPTGAPAGWAVHGWQADIATVGESVQIPMPGAAYDSASGTSFSGPAVAGAVALLRASHPGITVETVQAALQAAADSSNSWNRAWGAGRLAVPAALDAADRADGGVVVAPGAQSVTVSWAGVPGATSYSVRVDGVQRTVVGGTSTTIGGLVDGNQVAVDVQPDNGLRSRAVLATVGPAAPGTPVLHSATLGGTSGTATVTLSISVPGGAPNFLLVRDGVTLGTVDHSVSGSPTSVPVGIGPMPTHKTRWQVQIVGDYGRISPMSNAVTTGSVVPAPPPAITGLAAQADGDEVLLTWDDLGSAYTYRVTRGGSLSATPRTAGAMVAGPAEGDTWTYAVVAVDPWEQAGQATTIAVTGVFQDVPGAPALVQLSPSNGSVTVGWSAPGSNGGALITDYRLRIHEDGDLVRETSFGNGLSGQVTGLANGTAYTVEIAAANALGYGPSSTGGPVTPRTVPTAPAIGTATPGDRSAVVRWSAPASDGGSPVIRYTVRAYRGSSLAAVAYAPATATSVTVPGLLNRATYTFRVSAGNAAGSSPVSAASPAVVAGAPPSAPRAGTPSSGNGSIVARWGAPASDGGYAVSAYVVKVYAGTQLLKQVLATADVRALRVSGLPNGQSLTVTVAARNARGWSPESRPVSVVPHA